jgi:hypothetical protein
MNERGLIERDEVARKEIDALPLTEADCRWARCAAEDVSLLPLHRNSHIIPVEFKIEGTSPLYGFLALSAEHVECNLV